MKKTFRSILFAAAVLIAVTGCANTNAGNTGNENTETAEPGETTEIKWDQQTIDLGKIKHQVPKTVEFTFTNTGKAPLVISNVKTSCGCTVAEYSKEPIAPGDKGQVKAVYSAGSVGTFTKSLTVMANIPNGQSELTIQGEVEGKPEEK